MQHSRGSRTLRLEIDQLLQVRVRYEKELTCWPQQKSRVNGKHPQTKLLAALVLEEEITDYS